MTGSNARRSRLIAAALALASVLPLTAQAPAPSAPAAPPPAALVQRASDRIKALQREADQLAQQSTTTLAALRQLELTRALRAEELAQVNTRLSAVSDKVAASTARVQALEAQRVERTPALEERLQALYKRGRNGYVRLLLDTADERDLARSSRGVVSLAKIEEIRIAEHRRLLTEEQAARTQLAIGGAPAGAAEAPKPSRSKPPPPKPSPSAAGCSTNSIDAANWRHSSSANSNRRGSACSRRSMVCPARRSSTCRSGRSRAICRGRSPDRCSPGSAGPRPAVTAPPSSATASRSAPPRARPCTPCTAARWPMPRPSPATA